MASRLEPTAILPALREDLQLLPGKTTRSGQKTWLVFDGLRNRYFQIDTKSVAILRRWALGTPEKILSVLDDQDTRLEDFETLIRFLFVNSLTRDPAEGDVKSFVAQAEAGKKSIASSLVHNYLFFRIPLVRPHAFLRRTVHLTNFLFSPWWWRILAVILLIGGYLTLRQWDEFIHTFMYFFNLNGLIYYFLALIFVKIAHELGHAFTATRYGCRVATMGVAFLVMFPILFTDTTDSWRLQSSRQRLTITAAGVLTEFMIAIFATFLWAFLPDGPWRSAAFFVATTSWIMSVAVNFNPLMRFDGYHFLSDLIGIQNLQARSFAFGRWCMREFLFDLGDPVPEPMGTPMRRGLIAFAWATWVYRFFLFVGIALLVHALFFKALGIVLFCVEIGWFIMIPILNEIREWWKRRSDIVENGRMPVIAICLIVGTLSFFVPWQTTVHLPAVLEAEQQTLLFAQQAGMIDQIYVKNGDRIAAGEPLVRLHSPDIANQIELEERRLALINARLARIASDREDLDQNIVLLKEAKRLRGTIAGLHRQVQAMTIIAPFDGIVADLDPTLHIGRWINQSIPVTSVMHPGDGRIRGYVFAEHTDRLVIDAAAVFIPDQHELRKIPGKLQLIAAANAETITLPALTSRYGGPIAVAESAKDLNPLHTWYSVVVVPDQRSLAPEQIIRGEIHAKGRAESLAVRIWRRVAHILIRETTL